MQHNLDADFIQSLSTIDASLDNAAKLIHRSNQYVTSSTPKQVTVDTHVIGEYTHKPTRASHRNIEKGPATTAAADRCIKGCHVNSAPAREEYLLKSKSTLPVAPTMLQMDMQDWCGTAIISQAALDDNQHCYQTQDESADSSDQMTQLCPLTMSPNAHCASCRDYCGCWDSGSLLCANNLEPQCLITYMCSQEPHFDQIGIRSNTRSNITPVISLVSGLLLQLLVRSDQSVHTRSMLAIAPLFFLPVAHGDEDDDGTDHGRDFRAVEERGERERGDHGAQVEEEDPEVNMVMEDASEEQHKEVLK
mgnify:CR=1 FL=1